MKKLLNYFTEPYKNYDGNWKGLIYIERMADRRALFKLVLLFITMFVFSLSLSAQDVNTLLKEADSLAQVNKTHSYIDNKLEKVLKIEPRNEQALSMICEYYLNHNGAQHYAEDYINTLIEVNSNNAQYYWMRVQVFLSERASLEELKQSVLDLEKVIELSGKTTNRVLRAQVATYCILSSKYNDLANKEPETNVEVSNFDDPKPNPKKAEYYKNAKTAFDKGLVLYKELKLKDEDLAVQLNDQLYKCNFEENN